MLLEQRLVNISTVNQVGNVNLNRPGVVYCGRSSSQNKGCFNPMDLGLGNPFSHKNSKNCVWKVNSLDECLMSYRNWLWKLIQNERSIHNLTDWEAMYLYRFLNFCQNLDQVNTLVCFCTNTYHNALNKDRIACHTQIFWNAAIWYKMQRL